MDGTIPQTRCGARRVPAGAAADVLLCLSEALDSFKRGKGSSKYYGD